MVKIMNSFLSFAINSLFRRGSKNIFIYIVLALLITMVLSVFMVSGALKQELDLTVSALPEITVQKIEAGKQRDIDIERADEILNIPGVSNVFPRVWGYYYFDFAGVNFSIIGIDIFDNQYKKSLQTIANRFDDILDNETPAMIVGQSIYQLFQDVGYHEAMYFRKIDGSYIQVKIGGVFKYETDLESSDTIVLPIDTAREILSVHDGFVTDITVNIPNPEEIQTIAVKIQKMYPDVRIISKNDILISYQNIFDYKNGIFMVLLSIALFTFFIIIFDKLSGVSSEEKVEVGILKSLGWTINDIIRLKFYESVMISISAYLTGFLFSLIYVFYMNAPMIRNIFSGYSSLKSTFQLSYHFDIKLYVLVFLITVPVFIAATIIPSWKIASTDADEVLR